MKKMIPVIIAILLIVIVGAVSFGGKLIERYSYSKEHADLDEYYGVTDGAAEGEDGSLAIVLQDDFIPEQAVVNGGVVYFDLDTVKTYFNEIFYADRTEQKLLFTSADETFTASFGQAGYSDSQGDHTTEYTVCYLAGDKLYVAADYVRLFANFSWERFDRHLQVYTEWGVKQTYDIAKKTQLRVLGGIKSEILRELEKGETVELLEEMDTWSRVKTADSMIGYVENKRLENLNTEVEIPVTDYVPAEYTGAAPEGRISLGWHAVYGLGGNETLEDRKSVV